MRVPSLSSDFNGGNCSQENSARIIYIKTKFSKIVITRLSPLFHERVIYQKRDWVLAVSLILPVLLWQIVNATSYSSLFCGWLGPLENPDNSCWVPRNTDRNSYNINLIRRLSSVMRDKFQFAMKLQSHDRCHRVKKTFCQFQIWYNSLRQREKAQTQQSYNWQKRAHKVSWNQPKLTSWGFMFTGLSNVIAGSLMAPARPSTSDSPVHHIESVELCLRLRIWRSVRCDFSVKLQHSLPVSEYLA